MSGFGFFRDKRLMVKISFTERKLANRALRVTTGKSFEIDQIEDEEESKASDLDEDEQQNNATVENDQEVEEINRDRQTSETYLLENPEEKTENLIEESLDIDNGFDEEESRSELEEEDFHLYLSDSEEESEEKTEIENSKVEKAKQSDNSELDKDQLKTLNSEIPAENVHLELDNDRLESSKVKLESSEKSLKQKALKIETLNPPSKCVNENSQAKTIELLENSLKIRTETLSSPAQHNLINLPEKSFEQKSKAFQELHHKFDSNLSENVSFKSPAYLLNVNQKEEERDEQKCEEVFHDLNVGQTFNVHETNQLFAGLNDLKTLTIDVDDKDVVKDVDDVVEDVDVKDDENCETVDRLVLNDEARGKYNFRKKLKIPIKYRSDDEETRRNSSSPSKSPRGRNRGDEVGLSGEDSDVTVRSDSDSSKKIDFSKETYFGWTKNQAGKRKKKEKRSSRSPRMSSSSSMSDFGSQRKESTSQSTSNEESISFQDDHSYAKAHLRVKICGDDPDCHDLQKVSKLPEEDSSTTIEENSGIESAVEDEIVPDKKYFSEQDKSNETFSKTKTQISENVSEQNREASSIRYAEEQSSFAENQPLKVSKNRLKGKELTTAQKIPLSRDILELEENWTKKGFESSRPLRCNECDFFTFNTKSLVNHWISNHKVVVFECRQCPFTAKSPIEIMDHCFLQHKMQKISEA